MTLEIATYFRSENGGQVAPRRPRAVRARRSSGCWRRAGRRWSSTWCGPRPAQPSAPSNPPREQRKQAPATRQDAGDSRVSLDVGLEALKQPPPAPDEAGRNPFRFYVKPPPRPRRRRRPGRRRRHRRRRRRPCGAATAVPPPIPLKFIGTLEVRGRRSAIFYTDGKGMPHYAGEGETRPRAVPRRQDRRRVGNVMEYLDGRGRQTIPMRGDEVT